MPRRRTAWSAALAIAVVAASAAFAFACDDDAAPTIPVAVGPASRHDALLATLRDDARTFSFQDGDWLEDLGDAPFFGTAWLVHRTDLDADETTRRDQSIVRARALLDEDSLIQGDVQEKVMACLGLIERVGATGDRSDVPRIDSFIDRLASLVQTFGNYLEAAASSSWAIQTYGPTAVTALVGLVDVQYALLVGGDRAGERVAHAKTLDAAITANAFGDVGTSRGFAPGPDDPTLLDLYPNVAMLLLEARLYRLTKDPTYMLEARALYGAIQPLKLSDAPARYESPYAAAELQATTNDVLTLSSQNYLALALMVMFEITGEERFLDEADRVLDGIEQMRGPWCLAQVHTEACTPACGASQACVVASCTDDRCQQGLLHHIVDGRLAMPGDATLFCSGCNLQTLYVIGYRRSLANQPW